MIERIIVVKIHITIYKKEENKQTNKQTNKQRKRKHAYARVDLDLDDS